MYKVDNAIIMAAGTSSRFAPLSYEKPKALINVRGEVLIERQIRQLLDAGVPKVYIVSGYKAEMFSYLERKFGVETVHNPSYLNRNNNGSIYAVRDILHNSFVCSADNYFIENPFASQVEHSYYAAVYAKGETKEWCMQLDESDRIRNVTIGGHDSWIMLGHTFWDEKFSSRFLQILLDEYDNPKTAGLLWESIYLNHIDELDMWIKRYSDDVIFEFDTLDELREFDNSYFDFSGSKIMETVAKGLGCRERDIKCLVSFSEGTNAAAGFSFSCAGKRYKYRYSDESLREE